MTFKTIDENSEGIIIQKKSKFIAEIYYVENEEKIEEILNKTRKKYYDARHNCYAYRILKEGRIIERQSDDGEPSGTAGAPMLNILSKKELINVLVIVTRYFGGILLGTGGLVKAYSDALSLALDKSQIVQKEEGYVIEIEISYEDMRKFENTCIKNNIEIIEKEYGEKIKISLEILKRNYEEFVEKNLKINFQNIPVKIKQEKFIKIK